MVFSKMKIGLCNQILKTKNRFILQKNVFFIISKTFGGFETLQKLKFSKKTLFTTEKGFFIVFGCFLTPDS